MLSYFALLTVEPSIDSSLLPNEINAEVGKEFKITIPYKGGPIKKAQFTIVSRQTQFCDSNDSTTSPTSRSVNFTQYYSARCCIAAAV